MSFAIFLTSEGYDRWAADLGDPSALGWVTLAAYLAAAFMCYRAFKIARFGAEQLRTVAPREARNQRLLSRMWLGFSALMAFAGCNKQLDLQTLFIQIGRDLAIAQGWYESRHTVQVAFVLALVAAAGMFALAMAYVLRKVVKRIALALAGVALIGGYMMLRAAAFNHLAGEEQEAHNPFFALELIGIALVAAAGYRAALTGGASPWPNLRWPARRGDG